jgi:hypothetical protein
VRSTLSCIIFWSELSPNSIFSTLYFVMAALVAAIHFPEANGLS